MKIAVVVESMGADYRDLIDKFDNSRKVGSKAGWKIKVKRYFYIYFSNREISEVTLKFRFCIWRI